MMRPLTEQIQALVGAEQRKVHAVTVTEDVIAGVPVRRIAPASGSVDRRRTLLNLHGGGFATDSGSLTENIPIAALSGLEVVAVLYRFAPEHPVPGRGRRRARGLSGAARRARPARHRRLWHFRRRRDRAAADDAAAGGIACRRRPCSACSPAIRIFSGPPTRCGSSRQRPEDQCSRGQAGLYDGGRIRRTRWSRRSTATCPAFRPRSACRADATSCLAAPINLAPRPDRRRRRR